MATRATTAHLKTAGSGFAAAFALLAAVACQAAPQPCAVMIGGQQFVSRPAAFLEDGAVWAPADAVSKALDVELTASGQVFSVSGNGQSAPRKVVDGRDLVSLRPLADALGAETRLEKNSLSVLARVTDVRFSDGALRIKTSIPVLHQTRRLAAPDRIYIDLKGARIAGPPTESKSAASLVRALRLGQFDADTARITAETAGRVEFSVQSPARTASVVVGLNESAAAPPAAQDSKTEPAANALPVAITQVRVENTASGARFFVTADRAPQPELHIDSALNKVSLEFARATVSAPDRSWTFTGGPVQQAMLIAGGFAPSAVVLTATGSRPLTSRLLAGAGPNEIVWELAVPEGAQDGWQGKVIVIDPGHGGKDQGARANGLLEKDINLAVALVVKEEAERRGLGCVLTRSTDIYQTLDYRARTSAASQAALFISVHANSNGKANSVSGMEVYYHKQDPSSRVLAQLVHDEIASATGMKARGARSDLKLYKTGLSVLRNATVPAILVEMGYVNHASDARLLADTGFQEQAAKAVVEAVIRYLGGPDGEDAEGPG